MGPRILVAGMVLLALRVDAAQAQPAAGDGQAVTVRAERDIGFFTGDLVRADVLVPLPGGARLDPASLPAPGPVTYWLDLRGITLTRRGQAAVLHLVYQNFYVALDARRLEIPGFPVRLLGDGVSRVVDVPSWTIGVSPLREVAPPVQEDPKAYLQADRVAPALAVGRWRMVAGGLMVAAILALLPLAYHRAWGPFRRRPARDFAVAARHLRRLGARGKRRRDILRRC
ncbi:hypothetical protein [Nitrospirillum sp. BR 11828]|uniref:hypothetical protein n=1 Tax=Nitrospirillum sp. BR 11828 TaxID=3104325 RepID=UPI002ACA372C|nr:hypothetical protein [Nitrospirillum sp. BR 11828]MDZ5650006.1 hypothetical protein [Nitrospirillum sp. BR 11828]